MAVNLNEPLRASVQAGSVHYATLLGHVCGNVALTQIK